MSGRESSETRQLKSPDEILAELMEGNKRYTESLKQNSGASVDLGTVEVHNDLSPGVVPAAAVVTCADSRVAPEIIFDSAIGDIFVVRTAGNVVDPSNYHLLGSLEFGVLELGARLIMVLGHTGCGAVAGAIEVEKNGTEFPGSINKVVEKIVPSVEAVKGDSGDLWHNAILENVRESSLAIHSSCAHIAEKVSAGELKIVGGCFDLGTGEVTLL